MKSFILTILSVPGSLVSVIGKLFSHKKSNLMKKKEALPGAALITPVLPLVAIGIINFTVGLGNAADGKVDPIAAAVLGFVKLCARYESALMWAARLPMPSPLTTILMRL